MAIKYKTEKTNSWIRDKIYHRIIIVNWGRKSRARVLWISKQTGEPLGNFLFQCEHCDDCRRLRNLRPLLFLLFLGISLFVWEKILAFELGFCFLTRNYKRVRRWEDESQRQQSTGEKKVRWGTTRTWFPSFPRLLSFKSRHFLFGGISLIILCLYIPWRNYKFASFLCWLICF